MTLSPILLPDLATAEKAAQRLAPLLSAGDLLALQGPIGAGKTAFARFLLRALGIHEDVPSPTFTLMQIYETPRFPVYHFDLYRLASETELIELGWEDALGTGLVIVEWPERAAGQLPRDRLTLNFAFGDKDTRLLTITPQGNWVERIKDFA